MKITIAIDLMGGDKAPKSTIEGLKIALESHKDVHFLCFGSAVTIKRAKKSLKNRCEFFESTDDITAEDKVSIAVRKKESSMSLAIKATQEGRSHATISSGNTGALMSAEKGYQGEAYKYDVKSKYPFLLSSPLKFPIERGEFNILSSEEFNKMEYYQLGIYRVKIERSEDDNINKLFRFNKYNKYTHTSLEHAKSLNLKMTLIQDEKANFLYYSPEKRIGCNEIFGEYVSYMYDLKEKESKLKGQRKKEVLKAKLVLNCLWGDFVK
jgi:hypothetical protein